MSAEPIPELSVDKTTAANIESHVCYPKVSEEVAAAVRELVDDVVVPTSSRGDHARLHIGDGDAGTLCRTHVDGVSKPVECYPPGFRKWCVECVALYRLDHGGIDDA